MIFLFFFVWNNNSCCWAFDLWRWYENLMNIFILWNIYRKLKVYLFIQYYKSIKPEIMKIHIHELIILQKELFFVYFFLLDWWDWTVWKWYWNNLIFKYIYNMRIVCIYKFIESTTKKMGVWLFLFFFQLKQLGQNNTLWIIKAWKI